MDYMPKAEVTRRIGEIIEEGGKKAVILERLRVLKEQAEVPFTGENTDRARKARKKIIAFLAKHPDSTVKEVAMGVDFSYNFIRKILDQMEMDYLVTETGTRKRKGQHGKPPRTYKLLKGQ